MKNSLTESAQHPAPTLPDACVWGVVVAAGLGTRMGEGREPKQFLLLDGRPLYWRSISVMASCPDIRGIVLVLPKDFVSREEERIREFSRETPPGIPLLLTEGGASRKDSVRLGLERLPHECTHVLIHDGARPFLSAGLIHALVEELRSGKNAVIPAVPVNDTIKRVRYGQVLETPDREELLAVQTPQAFEKNAILKAHETLEGSFTDDASMLEVLGEKVYTIPGDGRNNKITYPSDLSAIMEEKTPRLTVGQGYDVHRFGGTRPVVLGGVPIPSGEAIQAHSDGDVLLHALMDALLGAAGLGDIGEHFPDSDPRFAGISSSLLLDHVLTLLREKGIVPCHIDGTVICERPKIAPHRDAIRANIARLLSLPKDAVNIKATTEEGLGFTGRKEGIKALCVALCKGMGHKHA
ncbi:MAG: 2-C-methyl-D-erythritol 4-phosphate cytidylyltransferase [Desulfovibrio sp.]|nr:2-C-methyl-D-erythritol 4-phosphate cytidylyltransferase [Desulfovibrio sp.]